MCVFVCLCMMKQRGRGGRGGGIFYRLLHTFKCNYPKIVQESV